MGKLSEIYEGWKNHIAPSSYLKKIIEDTSKERMEICNDCEHNSKFHRSIRPDVHCRKCGCTLIAKTKCLSCKCALKSPKWKAVVTKKELREMEATNEE